MPLESELLVKAYIRGYRWNHQLIIVLFNVILKT